jgi:hypothetical protein
MLLESGLQTATMTRDPLPRTGVTVPLDTVMSPGAYVCNWSGHLLRVPPRGLMPGGALTLNIVGGEPLTVTKICDDPDVPVPEARGLAWCLGLSVGF